MNSGRPRITKQQLKMKKAVAEMYYKTNASQRDIAIELQLPSISVVAELLRQDYEDRVSIYVEKAEPTEKETLEIVQFLRSKRRMGYNQISQKLNIPEDQVTGILRKNGYLQARIVYTPEERDKRIKEIIKLNSEDGLTVTEIAKRLNLSKQRISTLMSSVGYKPQSKSTLWKLRTSKYTPQLVETAVNDANEKISTLYQKYDELQSKLASHKYWANQKILEQRIIVIEMYMKFPSVEFKSAFDNNVRTISMLRSSMTPESNKKLYAQLTDIIDRAKDFKKKAEI